MEKNEEKSSKNLALATLRTKNATIAHTKARKKRQLAFLEYYKNSGFNISRACQMVPIERSTYYKWMKNYHGHGEGFIDEEGDMLFFKDMFEMAREEIKDMVEDSLMEQVRRRQPIVTIFVAKTLLKDRGYEETKQVKVTHDTLTKEQKDAVVKAYRIKHGDTVVEAIEGPVEEIKKLR